ncbi:beta-N-acetylhexosaminidase [Salinibacillus kushneri]|uniref:beta-N-acetylhexosaminidase n=2 Tax=Salinibacillus kushneri TaxID=237682 RepID=A0A1I0CPX3_9BACI|nr:beta-N-acetylhexosaminidase [Salinibacillus kushneri]
MIKKACLYAFILMIMISFPYTIGSSNPKDNQDNEDSIRQKVEALSLDEKIGQMLLVGFEGTQMNSEVKDYITNYRVGGLSLFKENIQNVQQATQLLNQIKSQNKGQIPLFLGVDEEGGKISRVPDEFQALPDAWEIGEVDQPELSFQYGNIIASQIQALGFNMDFAPVLDIHTNSKNPIIGRRAFGSTVKKVKRHGLAVMNGIRASGVISVVKHFPGHGDTSLDSHEELPVVKKSLKKLQKYELKPFKAAIKQNADAIMMAHLSLAKIDPKYPTSLSKVIIQNILRQDLNFDGLVITDDLTMKAITNDYKVSDAAVQSVKAGSDILLIAHEKENVRKTHKKLKQAVLDGEISEKRINESVYRILDKKRQYNIHNDMNSPARVNEINQQIKELLSKINDK